MKILHMQIYAISIHFFLHTMISCFQLLFHHFYLHILHDITKYIPFLSSLPYSQAVHFVSILHNPNSQFLLFSLNISLSAQQLCLSVDRPLEDEFDVALFPSQPRSTERTSSVEGMRSVRQWDLTPALHRLFRAHVTTGAECMCWRPCIQV